MSSRKETVADLLDALSTAGPLTTRAMFGEYAVYLDGRVVALVCDDTLWVKPTPGARAALPDARLGPPFPRATDYLCAEGALDDPDPVIVALRAAATELPLPKPKSPRRKVVT
jgi:TfoX N-terminal domain